MRNLNSFILIGAALVIISLLGLATQNRLLTEPGQPINSYAWLEYLAAAVVMFINGIVSIRLAREHDKSKPSDNKAKAETAPTQ